MKRAIAILALLGTAVLPQQLYAAPCNLDIGEQAPQLVGADLTGSEQDLSQYQGKWVFVDFWATWCKPCMREIPSVVDLHQKLASRPDFAVLSVSLDEGGSREALEKTTTSYGISYPVLFDGSGWMNDNARGWCVNAIPATFLIDPQGRVVARDISPSRVMDVIGQLEPVQRPVQRSRPAIAEPLTVSFTETLLPDSPSTGRSQLQDLLLNISIPENQPFVSRYQLYLRYWLQDPSKNPAALDLRYDVDITLDQAESGFPYYVDIRETSGNSRLVEEGRLPAVAALAEISGSIPGLAVALDVQRKSYQFVVPVPPACNKLAYAIAIYDPQLQQYLSNGVNEVVLDP